MLIIQLNTLYIFITKDPALQDSPPATGRVSEIYIYTVMRSL